MLESKYRTHYDHYLVQPVCQFLPTWLGPKWITSFAVVTGMLVPFCLINQHVYLAVLLLLLSGYLDTLDGGIARARQQQSTLGSGLDIIADRIVEFAVIYGLYLVDPVARATLVIWMLGAISLCVTSFLVVAIFSVNDTAKGFYYHPGLIERFEAFGFFTAMILLPEQFQIGSTIFICLVIWTTLIRIYQFGLHHFE